MAGVNEFIQNNAKWLLVLLFTAGISYSELKSLNGIESRVDAKVEIVEKEFIKELEVVEKEFKQELKVLEERLGKKIKIIQENEDKIHALEIRVVKLETKNK